MINLTTVSSLSKKLILPTVVLFLLSFLSLLIFIRFSNLKVDQEPSLPQVEPLHFDTLPGIAGQFKTDRLSLQESAPDKLPVYKLNSDASFLPGVQALAQKLNFTTPPQELDDQNLGNGLLFTTTDSALSVYQKVVSYQKTVPKTEGLFNEAMLKAKALDFITSLKSVPINPEQEVKTTYVKLTNEGPIPTDNPADADRIKFEFGQAINGLAVIAQDNVSEITLDAVGNVTSFTFRALELENELGSYPIIGVKDALKLLQTGKGYLVKIEGGRADVEAIRKLGDVSLSAVYLAYYLPTKTQDTFQPVWAFEGESLINGLKISTTYVVPAVTND